VVGPAVAFVYIPTLRRLLNGHRARTNDASKMTYWSASLTPDLQRA
jgi:hypothetical protein